MRTDDAAPRVYIDDSGTAHNKRWAISNPAVGAVFCAFIAGAYFQIAFREFYLKGLSEAWREGIFTLVWLTAAIVGVKRGLARSRDAGSSPR